MKRKRRRTFTCAHCGATVPSSAPACPECGSDDRTGWSPDAEAWAGDLPVGYGDDDEDDAYEETLRNEGLAADGRPSRQALRRRWVAAVCLLLILGLVLLWAIGRG